jgi:hypothetical protein
MSIDENSLLKEIARLQGVFYCNLFIFTVLYPHLAPKETNSALKKAYQDVFIFLKHFLSSQQQSRCTSAEDQVSSLQRELRTLNDKQETLNFNNQRCD